MKKTVINGCEIFCSRPQCQCACLLDVENSVASDGGKPIFPIEAQRGTIFLADVAVVV